MYYLLTDENDMYSYYNNKKIIDSNETIKINSGLNINRNGSYILVKNPYDRCPPEDYSYYLRVGYVLNNTHYSECSGWIHSDSVILSDRYYVYDHKTIKKFNIPVHDNFIKYACLNGAIKFLEWWTNSGLPLEYHERALDSASFHGRIDVLDWWFKSGLPLKYDTYALNWASLKGHINVLEWWFKSGLELKYSTEALQFASYNGHIDVLEWWLKSKLPLEYDEDILMYAYCSRNYLDILKWWKKLPIKYDDSKLNFGYSYDYSYDNPHDLKKLWKSLD